MAIGVTGKFKPKSNNFAIVDAQDVEMPDGKRLSECMPVMLSRSAYQALVDAEEVNPDTPYLIYEDEDNEGDSL